MVDREAIKDRVLAYLDRKVRTKRTPDLKSFTVESISAAIREDERIVERVLAELERDNWVRSTNIQFRIYLPTSAESQRTLTSLAQAGALTFPPFLSAAAGITAVYLIFAYQAPAPEEIFEVAKHGGQLDGVIAAGILGLGTGLGFHTLLRRLLRWRLIASGPYARLVQNLKWVFAGGLLASSAILELPGVST